MKYVFRRILNNEEIFTLMFNNRYKMLSNVIRYFIKCNSLLENIDDILLFIDSLLNVGDKILQKYNDENTFIFEVIQ